MGRVEKEEKTGMRVGIEEEEVGASEERKGSMNGVERQRREVERGRGRGGGAVVERENREVERERGRGGEGVLEREKREVEGGRGGRGKRGQRGESGSSIMGCRMSTDVWQVAR